MCILSELKVLLIAKCITLWADSCSVYQYAVPAHWTQAQPSASPDIDSQLAEKGKELKVGRLHYQHITMQHKTTTKYVMLDLLFIILKYKID